MAKKRSVRKKNIKKKSFNLLREYRESWNYLKESKKFIYLATGIFFLFLLIGFFIPTPQFIYDEIIKFIRELMNQTQDMSQLDMIGFIISNNVQTTFLNIIFGAFFGIFPLIDAVANGYVLGFVSSISVNNSGLLSLWKILPHGIFELPAVFISFGLGLKTGMFIFHKDKIKTLKNYFINSLKVFLLIIVPLLIIAGIIEGTLIFLLK
jgi:stage II sporulation protein M